MQTDQHLARTDEKIARLEKRLAELSVSQARESARSNEAGWDVGGIRTTAGRARAARGLEATISRSVEIERLTRELNSLRAHREAYAAGRVNKQGYPLPPSGERLAELIRGTEALLARGAWEKTGKPLTDDERDNLGDLLKRYRALARKEARQQAATTA